MFEQIMVTFYCFTMALYLYLQYGLISLKMEFDLCILNFTFICCS
jgi:hypothetical protein